MRHIYGHAEGQGYGAPTWGSNRVRAVPRPGPRGAYAIGFSPSAGSGFTPLHRSVASAVPG